MPKYVTRQQLAEFYGISRRTLYSQLKKNGIHLKSRGLISPKELQVIFEKLGVPYGFIRSDAFRDKTKVK